MLEEATTPLRHDIRNRIASVRNLAFFVRRKLSNEVLPERDPRVQDFLVKIEGEVQRTDEVIEGWSARVQGVCPSHVACVNVSDCLHLAFSCARVPAQVALKLQPLAENIEVDGDTEALAFAVRCLLENAAEAIGSGEVRVTAERSADSCTITVTDLGPGIAEPARCLERFQSSKPGHLGLGLCMARRVALRFGGELLIGTPEVGAQVSLLVPIAGTRSAKGEQS